MMETEVVVGFGRWEREGTASRSSIFGDLGLIGVTGRLWD